MRLARRRWVVALGALGLLLALAGVAYALDSGTHDDEVARNVRLGGRDVGGLDRRELAEVVADVARRFPSTPVRVESDPKGFSTRAGVLGVTVDQRRTIEAVMDVGRAGALPGRFSSWLSSFIRARRAPLEVDVEVATARAAVARLDPGPRAEPAEPSIAVRDGEFVAVAGTAGRGIDADELVRRIVDDPGTGGEIEVEVPRVRLTPRFSRADAEALAERATALTRTPLRVRAGDQETTVPTARLRTWLTAEEEDRRLVLALDPEKTRTGLRELLPEAGEPPVDAGFAVTASGIVPTPAKEGTACCAPNAPDRILAALEAPARPGAVELPLVTVPPRRTSVDAERLGIKEQVASFTTHHRCCEPRVTNIHRIADILRGHVIEPGETFSVNAVVGRRTKAKGFVVAGVIEDGEFKEDVGGGVSQFATTAFNAAFFAGLDFGEYQSHSIYISRYPYGREATMGFPHPDLQIRNTTPYGVLLWPTYDSRSVTVTLYSTKHYRSVDALPQTKGQRGSCTVVTTPRVRVSLDGRERRDSVRATYRAGEGIDCDESPTTRPPATTRPQRPATTAPPPATSAPSTTQPT